MARKLAFLTMTTVMAAAGWLLASHLAVAGEAPLPSPPLNYYVPPGSPEGVAAAMYPAPRPTPPLVGCTYITNEALAPHQFLYEHHRRYVRYTPDGGTTRTRVKWWHGHTFGPSVMWSGPNMNLPPAGPVKP